MEQNRTTAPERKRRTNKKAEEAVETQEATAADATPLAPEAAEEGLDARMLAALHAAGDKKAHDLLALDLRPVASFTDFFLIGSAQNTRQVQAIADEIVERLRAMGSRAARVEGYTSAEWVLLDFGDFVFHIFEQKARRFYELERLWRDAARVALPPELSAAAAADDARAGSDVEGSLRSEQ
ncbi:MAG TPA: ribosome silencing factor [Pyrinomonadaceae bacterium]